METRSAATRMAAGDDIRNFYGSGPADVQRAWDRRSCSAVLETALALRIMRSHLPSPPARIYDIGGGNGYFAFALSDIGYEVSLSDLTPALIMDARVRDAERGSVLRDATVADARSLPYPDESGDAALYFGPFYGLPDQQERHIALRELARVLRPGAVVMVDSLTTIGTLRGLAIADPGVIARVDVDRLLSTGVVVGDGLPAFFQGHVSTHPEDASAELAGAGFEVVETIGIDGPHPYVQPRLRDCPQAVVDAWADLALQIGRDPRNWNSANHVVHVARRPA